MKPETAQAYKRRISALENDRDVARQDVRRLMRDLMQQLQEDKHPNRGWLLRQLFDIEGRLCR